MDIFLYCFLTCFCHWLRMSTSYKRIWMMMMMYTSLHQRWTSFPAFSNIMAICSCQGRQRQHTDLAVSPSTDLVSGISYLRLYVYHRHLDSFKASWRQYFYARPTRHDSARSWLLRLLELRLTNFPTYLLTYLIMICFGFTQLLTVQSRGCRNNFRNKMKW